MSSDPSEFVVEIFRSAAAAHQRFIESRIDRVLAASDSMRQAFGAGCKVLAFGNGGSASDAQHLVAELVGRFESERPGLPAIALTTDTSVLTAVANDYGYQHVFARQIEALGNPGDVAFGISTSGKSPNVEAALATAKAKGLVTIALTGCDGGTMGRDANVHLNVAETSTARIQEVHRTIMHAICALVDRT
jgi:D-sedoheptulose 7-phosphate isomerase